MINIYYHRLHRRQPHKGGHHGDGRTVPQARKESLSNTLHFKEQQQDEKLFQFYPCEILLYTVCPGSSDPFYIISYYIKWVTTFWTHSKN